MVAYTGNTCNFSWVGPGLPQNPFTLDYAFFHRHALFHFTSSDILSLALAFFIWEYIIIKLYIQYRQSETRHNKASIFYLALITSLLPLVFVKLVPLLGSHFAQSTFLSGSAAKTPATQNYSSIYPSDSKFNEKASHYSCPIRFQGTCTNSERLRSRCS